VPGGRTVHSRMQSRRMRCEAQEIMPLEQWGCQENPEIEAAGIAKVVVTLRVTICARGA
jgi:hypothetical protein